MNAVFDDGWVRAQLFSLAEARKLLFDYFYHGKKLFMWHRTPLDGDHFDSDWDHLNHLLI